jgi:hypothetical protein
MSYALPVAILIAALILASVYGYVTALNSLECQLGGISGISCLEAFYTPSTTVLTSISTSSTVPASVSTTTAYPNAPKVSVYQIAVNENQYLNEVINVTSGLSSDGAIKGDPPVLYQQVANQTSNQTYILVINTSEWSECQSNRPNGWNLYDCVYTPCYNATVIGVLKQFTYSPEQGLNVISAALYPTTCNHSSN